MVKTKIEIRETKEKRKVDVKVDSEGIGWVTKTDFDYAHKKYISQLKISTALVLECFAFIILYLLK